MLISALYCKCSSQRECAIGKGNGEWSTSDGKNTLDFLKYEKKKKCSLFPFLVVFFTWKRKDEDTCLFLCLVHFSNAKVIEICVSWDLSVEPMNVRL